MAMRLIPDMGVFQKKLATLPLATYQAGETALSAASRTGRLLILKEGAVVVVKEGVEIARVVEPGAVFGELSVLLNQPHTADVRAVTASQFYVADAATLLTSDPTALLYVATVLAQRLDSANRSLLELKRQVQAGESRDVIGRTVEKIEGLLGETGANLGCMPAILRTRTPETHRQLSGGGGARRRPAPGLQSATIQWLLCRPPSWERE
jgi:CRP/FNR family cyclic AMP-dependent transcriptional regulator